MVAVLLRGRFALVGAAIRAADAIDRVQGRENDQDGRRQKPSHELIIVCFLVGIPYRVNDSVVALCSA